MDRARRHLRGSASLKLINALLLVMLSACGPGIETEPLAAPDRARFEAEAAPLIAKRCGDVACHGTERHAFALYAVGRRRLRVVDTYSAKPLTTAEIDANFFATLGFLDAEKPLDTTLLKKALGQGHGGGAVFAHPSDPECQAVLRWLR